MPHKRMTKSAWHFDEMIYVSIFNAGFWAVYRFPKIMC